MGSAFGPGKLKLVVSGVGFSSGPHHQWGCQAVSLNQALALNDRNGWDLGVSACGGSLTSRDLYHDPKYQRSVVKVTNYQQLSSRDSNKSRSQQ